MEMTKIYEGQKGIIHFNLQLLIKNLFTQEAELEKSFPSIQRIADVACLPSKRIYEIQYSPITLEEAKARCHDYESLGFTVIWILHENAFNKRKKSSSERFLRTKTCYYTNMDEEGNGMIYDFLKNYGKRPINLQRCRSLPAYHWPDPLFERSKTWPFFHEGDFFDLVLKRQLVFSKKRTNLFFTLKEGYVALLHLLLKKNSMNML